MRAALVILLAGWALAASAQERAGLVIQEGSGRNLQVAVQRFAPPPDQPGSQRPEEFDLELSRALEFSGIVSPVPRKAFLEGVDSLDYENRRVSCENWKGIGADGLVQGRFEVVGTRVRVHWRLWDTIRCQAKGAPAWEEDEVRQLPWMARRIADEIVHRFTGRRGVSATEIAFVSDKTGNKEIYLMNADGTARRGVTSNRSINLFPGWSPKGDVILYTSYRGGIPDVWAVSRGAARPGRVLATPASKFRGVWAHHDGQIALVMNQQANTDIFVLRQGTKDARRITFGSSIETSPSWSPDGQKLAFVSDQSGSPQVYVRDFASGETRRLTYRGAYNASPAWSPTGEWIAFAAQTDNSFDLYVIAPEGGEPHPVVVHPRSDETPSWSPDGRRLAFSSNRYGRKEVFSVDLEGRNLVRLAPGFGNSQDPAWGPWLD